MVLKTMHIPSNCCIRRYKNTMHTPSTYTHNLRTQLQFVSTKRLSELQLHSGRVVALYACAAASWVSIVNYKGATHGTTPIHTLLQVHD